MIYVIYRDLIFFQGLIIYKAKTHNNGKEGTDRYKIWLLQCDRRKGVRE